MAICAGSAFLLIRRHSIRTSQSFLDFMTRFRSHTIIHVRSQNDYARQRQMTRIMSPILLESTTPSYIWPSASTTWAADTATGKTSNQKSFGVPQALKHPTSIFIITLIRVGMSTLQPLFGSFESFDNYTLYIYVTGVRRRQRMV